MPRVVVQVCCSVAVVLASAGCVCFDLSDTVYRAHMKTAFSPGAETTSLDALNPDFRDRLERVLSDLQSQGWHPYVKSTYRSPSRQELMHTYSRTKEYLGANPGTHARGGESCHNHRDELGLPSSLAADIIPGTDDKQSEKSRARFYWALGKAAKKHGLAWGGRWAKSNPVWRRYGLGWDPPHVQSKACTWRVLKKDREAYAPDPES